jgi:ABC-type xylose transport system substrate-binding protein
LSDLVRTLEVLVANDLLVGDDHVHLNYSDTRRRRWTDARHSFAGANRQLSENTMIQRAFRNRSHSVGQIRSVQENKKSLRSM